MKHIRAFESFSAGKYDTILDLIVHTIPYAVELGRNKISDIPVLALDVPAVWKNSGKEVSITEGYEFFTKLEKEFNIDVLEMQTVDYKYYDLKELFSKHAKHFASEMKKIPLAIQRCGLGIDEIYGALGYHLDSDEATYHTDSTMAICILLKEDEKMRHKYRGHIASQKFDF